MFRDIFELIKNIGDVIKGYLGLDGTVMSTLVFLGSILAVCIAIWKVAYPKQYEEKRKEGQMAMDAEIARRKKADPIGYDESNQFTLIVLFCIVFLLLGYWLS